MHTGNIITNKTQKVVTEIECSKDAQGVVGKVNALRIIACLQPVSSAGNGGSQG